MMQMSISPLRMALVADFAACVLLSSSVQGAETQETPSKPINLALFDPVQIVPRDQSVKGFRFSLIYGRNYDVEGLDLSLVGLNDNDFKGVQLALVGLSNRNFNGLQWATVSWTGGSLEGVQLGFFNGAKDMKWVQFGGVNYSEAAEGLQLSFFNWTESLHGLQIGIVNVAKNGFLPVFPLFNFNFEE
jgi:uncharacterized protein YjbI with pentapeptide repeats